MLEIIVTDKKGHSKTFRFSKYSVMLGRATGNDVEIPSSGVSRYHARISVEGEEIIIQDLEATNGTFVNTKRITVCTLVPGDVIKIGDVSVTAALIPEESDADEESPIEDEASLEDTQEGMAALPTIHEEGAESKSSGSSEDEFYWESLERFLAPVWPYIVDDSVSEIMINGPQEVFIEKGGVLHRTDTGFTEDELKAAVLNIAQYVGRRVDEQEPYLDARLPDGSRVAVLSPPCSRRGISVAIRKFSKEKLTLDRLIEFGSLTDEMVKFLTACVALRKNIIISGGTSSGKTSLLNVASSLIPEDERIITIEDSAELQLCQEHVLPMETKPPDKKGRGQVTIRDLVRASLRMRPDRIIVGEIRGGEALDLLQAMNTGHSGSMSTVHASSPRQALGRLETLALFSGFEIPMHALREQVSSAIDFIVQAARLPDHTRKVTHISEVGGLEKDGTYIVRDIFRFNRMETFGGKIRGIHGWTGEKPSIIEEMEMAGFGDAIDLFKETERQ